jgi:hypothetical protein
MRSLAPLLLLAACGDGDESIDRWQGADPHVTVRGSFDGVDLDLRLDGDDAADLSQAACKREYLVPDATDPATWDEGAMPELEVTIRVVDGDVEKQYELGFTGADFATLAIPARLEVAPPVADGAPAAGDAFLELDWQWEDPAEGFISFEESAVSGTIEIAELSGEPGDGVVLADGTGALGVWFDATWANGSLSGSLTVPCGPNEVE